MRRYRFCDDRRAVNRERLELCTRSALFVRPTSSNTAIRAAREEEEREEHKRSSSQPAMKILRDRSSLITDYTRNGLSQRNIAARFGFGILWDLPVLHRHTMSPPLLIPGKLTRGIATDSDGPRTPNLRGIRSRRRT